MTRPDQSLWRESVDLVRTFLIAFAAAAAIHALVLEPFTIPSSSMEPGLLTGDYIVVSKLAYGWSRASLPFDPPLPAGRFLGRGPRRGDVVVFRLPRDPQQTWVKRVIGLPGDRVQVAGGIVRVNGQALAQTPLRPVKDQDSPDLTVMLTREALPDGPSHLTYDRGRGEGDDTGVYVVPAGHYFMMGDNRDNSLDSRWPREVGVGLLPADNIVGKAEMVLWSWKPGAALSKPWTWLALRGKRGFTPIR